MFHQTKFSSLHHKGGDIASVNYLKVKNDVSYWNRTVPDRNRIHTAPNFLFLSG